jgi:hypothetical protein
MKRVALLQSNYVPWKGYFHMMASVDEFILYDEVQYTRQDWRNRNRIKTPAGLQWLTIPVSKGNLGKRIDETVVSDPRWASTHLKTLRQMYASTPYFDEHAERLEALYQQPSQRLSEINRGFLELIAGALGITTPLRWSTEYDVAAARRRRVEDDDPSELVAALCEAAGATVYVSGPAARAYLEPERFDSRGIEIEYFEYGPYPEYEQPHPPFEHAVTALDLLFCVGSAEALSHLSCATSVA